MERLTNREGNGLDYDFVKEMIMSDKKDVSDELLHKLAYYENTEEDGRMIILPCKPGDTVYQIQKEYISYKCLTEINNATKWVIDEISLDKKGIMNAMVYNMFGRDIFTTREAAEQRKAELERGETT